MTAPTAAQVAAYDDGARAYADGKPSSAALDAHPPGELRTLWIRGWTQARIAARHPNRD